MKSSKDMRKAAKSDARRGRGRLVLYHALLLAGVFVFWYLMTEPLLWSEEAARKTAFFFGKPLLVLQQIWEWFAGGKIYEHLLITLIETLLAFAIGTLSGLGVGLWLALSPLASALADPYIKASNAMPRVILAPIFAVWFGLGIVSKVALGFTLVFFIVFFNVYQGVKEVSPVVLNNARMLGANSRQLLRTVYLPSAMSWVFSSLHTVGRHGVCRRGGRRIPRLGARRRLPDSAGRGRVRHQYRVRRHPGADRVRARARCGGHGDRKTAPGVAAGAGGDGTAVKREAGGVRGEAVS